MPQVFKTDRPKRLEVHIPQSLRAKLDLELYSELEGRVPHGALSNLLVELISEWLRSRGVVA